MWVFGGYPITPSSGNYTYYQNYLQLVEFVCKWKMRFLVFVQVLVQLWGKKSYDSIKWTWNFTKIWEFRIRLYFRKFLFVVVNVMRGGPSTGLPYKSCSRWYLQAKNPTHGDVKSITLMPGNLTECYTEVVRA